MCFVRANSDFLFWQNLTPTKKKKTQPNPTTLLGHSHETAALPHLPIWDQGGLCREKGSALAQAARREHAASSHRHYLATDELLQHLTHCTENHFACFSGQIFKTRKIFFVL